MVLLLLSPLSVSVFTPQYLVDKTRRQPVDLAARMHYHLAPDSWSMTDRFSVGVGFVAHLVG